MTTAYVLEDCRLAPQASEELAAIAIDGERIAYAGPLDAIPAPYDKAPRRSLEGRGEGAALASPLAAGAAGGESPAP